MKRKILSVLFALVLVLSFSLVTAVPAAAVDGTIEIDKDYVADGQSITITVTDSDQAGAGTYYVGVTSATEILERKGVTDKVSGS